MTAVQVSQIFVHPIKSCKATSVKSWRYTPQGLEYDREWTIVYAETKRVISARTVPKTVLITPVINFDESSPFGGSLTISFPAGAECETFSVPLNPTKEMLSKWKIEHELIMNHPSNLVDGYICEALEPMPADSPSVILSKFIGKPVHLVYKGPRPRPVRPTVTFPDLKGTARYQDLYPVQVMSEESMDEVNKKVQDYIGVQGVGDNWKTDKVTVERFRPNILVKGAGPFVDESWEKITIGSGPTMILVAKCPRCLLPNVNPETGERDKAVPFKVLMKFRPDLDPNGILKPYVGCNAVPEGDGIINLGDLVHVKKTIF